MTCFILSSNVPFEENCKGQVLMSNFTFARLTGGRCGGPSWKGWRGAWVNDVHITSSWKGLSFTHKLWGHDVCSGLKPQGYSTAPAEAGLRDNALAPFMGRYLLALAIDGGASVKQPVSPEGDVGKAKPGRVGSDESITRVSRSVIRTKPLGQGRGWQAFQEG